MNVINLPHGANHRALGMLGEYHAREKLREAGYLVEFVTARKVGDLRVVNPQTGEIVRVEVKTARSGNDGMWQFCLSRTNKTGSDKTNCGNADITILQCVVGKAGLVVAYAIPSKILAGMRKINLRTVGSARSKWSKYIVGSYTLEEVNQYEQKVA